MEIKCAKCGESYYHELYNKCPYCGYNNICPECGYPNLKENEEKCPECGCPNLKENEEKSPECGCQTLQNQSNYDGDNEAEEILRKVLDSFRKLIILVGFIGSGLIFLGSIALDIKGISDVPIFWFLGLIVAALNIIIWIWLAKLMWAVGMVFVNISTNIRIIKKSVATPK